MISPCTATMTPTACCSTKFGEDLIARLHDWSGGFIDLVADGAGLHDLGVAGGAEGRCVGRSDPDGRMARRGARRQRPFAMRDGAMDGIPYLLLILLDHGALADGGLNHESVGRALAAAPKVAELSVQRPGSIQKTPRSMGSAPAGTMRSLAMTRSCLPPVTISPARRRSGLEELLTRTSVLT